MSSMFLRMRGSLPVASAALAAVVLLAGAAPTHATVLIVKSDDLPQYERPIATFESAFNGEVEVVDIEGSREKGERRLREAAARTSVEAIFALGAQAAYLSRTVLPEVPMTFSMVLDWHRYDFAGTATGVAVEIPVDALFTRFKLLLPDVERLGVIHGEHTSRATLEAAEKAARDLGIELVSEEVRHPEEVAGAYRRIRTEIDALWMLPDPVVITRDNFRYLAQRCRKDDVAFLAFSENFVRAGALLSIAPDYATMGSQAAVLVQRLVEDGETAVAVQAPIGSSLVINAEVARDLGLDLGAAMLGMADSIVGSR